MSAGEMPEPCLRPPHNVCAYEGCQMTCALRHPASLAPSPEPEFGPGNPEWCPVGKPPDEPHMHCTHWENCEPCCRCGDDTPDPNCDCDRCTAYRSGGSSIPGDTP